MSLLKKIIIGIILTLVAGSCVISFVSLSQSGEAGNGIVSIVLTKTEGLKDTYTITYTNGTTSEFTVTNGAQGIQGIQGEKGDDGHTPVITIQNGNWYIDGVDTGKAAQGVKGETGNGIASITLTKTEGLKDTYTITYTDGTTSEFIVTNGAQGIQGIQGVQGPQGEQGKAIELQVSATHIQYRYEGEATWKDLISLDSLKGEAGNGIVSIVLTKTEGLKDTYTITYTDGTTSEFIVTNGAQGIQGIQGEKGDDGHTPVITIQNGNWYIDGVDTGKAAQGPQGPIGPQGPQGPQGEQGVSVVNAYINAEYHLIIVLSNGQEIDAGYVGVEITPSVKKYTVIFKDYDGSILKTEEVESGDSATAPVNPSRDGYRFTGWDVTFNNVTSDLIVTAQYIKQYKVVFKDYDGEILKEQDVDSGAAATAPANPTRDGYDFIGWDVTFNNVSTDLIITAQYEQQAPKINILSFSYVNNGDGTLTVKLSISGDTVLYNGMDGYITYDDTKLTFVKAKRLSELSGSVNGSTDSGKVYMSIAGDTNVETPEDVLEVTFSFTSPLDTSVSLVVEDIFNVDFEPVEYSIQEGKITIN